MRRSGALVALALLTACSANRGYVFDTRPIGPCIGDGHVIPLTGWLADDGSLPSFDGTVSDRSPGLDDLLAALPAGFEVTFAEEVAVDDCAMERIVEVADDDGGRVWVQVRQLEDPGTLFNIPLSARQAHGRYGARGEIVTDDFAGDGTRVTALVISDTGGWTLVIARGADSDELSGWPTTMATTARSNAAEPAPLTLEQVTALAQRISAATSGD